MERELLLILKNGPIHSTSDHVAHQVETLSERFDCELWAPGSIDVDEPCGRSGRIRIVRMPEPAPIASQLRYVLLLVRRVRALRKQYGSRIILLAHDPLKTGLIGVLLRWIIGAPLVVEINGVFASADNLLDVATPEVALQRIARRRRAAKFVLSRADGVRLLFEEQLDGFVVPPSRIARATFFDVSPLSRFRNAGERPIVLFIGYPFFLKGVDLLIRAFDRVAEDFPDWELHLIGHNLDRQVRLYTSNPRVKVFKAMLNPEVADHMNSAGIFVLPSRSEAMGRVLLEAAAAGKPRIAARVGGVPSVVRHGVDGLLFEKNDSDELARHLRALMASPDLRQKLGGAAAVRAGLEFTDRVYAEHMSRLVDAARLASSRR